MNHEGKMKTTALRQEREELRDLLIKKAYFREKIILSSGKQSDYYIDARRVTLTSQGAYLAGRLMLDAIKDEKIDAIGGPTLGADPLIGAIAVLRLQEGKPINTFIIRKTPKSHGKQQQIEGPDLKAGSRVVLIDDVATTGQAFCQSIDILTRMGVQIVKAICLVDRQEGAKEAVLGCGCQFVSIFSASEIHKP